VAALLLQITRIAFGDLQIRRRRRAVLAAQDQETLIETLGAIVQPSETAECRASYGVGDRNLPIGAGGTAIDLAGAIGGGKRGGERSAAEPAVRRRARPDTRRR